jgi:Protein of unknown function (DUF3179)
MVGQSLEDKKRVGAARLWVALLFTLVPLICLAVPMYVIRPFRPQDPTQLALALTIRNLGPWLSAFSCVVVFAITFWGWGRSRRIWLRAVLTTLCLIVVAGACLTNVNIFEVMFHPYRSPVFSDAGAARIDSDDKVLAIKVGGDAHAYPIRTMGYHHIVNDTVGGTPVAVTYCTLCHTGLVWNRLLNGTTLHFRLAGINNGNALMRDEESNSIWQQSTGEAIFGLHKGQHLQQIHSDELTFALWRTEQPKGKILKPDAKNVADYESKDWEKHVEKTPAVIDTTKTGIAPHELMLGVTIAGRSKAYPVKSINAAKFIQDHVGEAPILIVVGPDNASIRVFKAGLGESRMTFLSIRSTIGANESISMRDAETGSNWNFEGCAIDGMLAGRCLEAMDSNKDYWFDWMNHHPDTLVFRS